MSKKQKTVWVFTVHEGDVTVQVFPHKPSLADLAKSWIIEYDQYTRLLEYGWAHPSDRANMHLVEVTMEKT